MLQFLVLTNYTVKSGRVGTNLPFHVCVFTNMIIAYYYLLLFGDVAESITFSTYAPKHTDKFGSHGMSSIEIFS